MASVVAVPAPAAQPKGDVKVWRSLYETECATCHGRSGRGNGPVGRISLCNYSEAGRRGKAFYQDAASPETTYRLRGGPSARLRALALSESALSSKIGASEEVAPVRPPRDRLTQRFPATILAGANLGRSENAGPGVGFEGVNSSSPKCGPSGTDCVSHGSARSNRLGVPFVSVR